MEEYITIGHTKKTFGVKGGLKAHIAPEYLEALVNTEVVFLKINNKPTPFFIEGIEEINGIVLFFEDVNSKETAYPFCASEIQLRVTDLKGINIEIDAPSSEFQEYIDFQVEVEGVGQIGKIEEIASLPEQYMAIIIYKNQEVLIPLNEQFIKEIDQKNKRLKMELPEGLLDL